MINYFQKNAYLLLLLGSLSATGQANAQSNLEAYIHHGLTSNQSIQQQNFLLQKNVYALQEAKTLFLPNISFATTYTKADGGRTIDFPTGDLFNAAYATLNQLTGANSFPQLKNQRILINPDNFYDAKLHTTMPILNAELVYNRRIKTQQTDLQKAEVNLYKRELVKEIKTAYYKYLKAINAVKIYESSLRLVQEGQRINTSLFNNNKVNRTAVLRSNNEVSRLNASYISATQTAAAARYYFNFLINRPLTDTILVDEINTLPYQDKLLNDEITGREEMTKLRIARELNSNLNRLAKSYIVPKIGTFLDLGSQAFNWKVNSQSRYYFAGVSLEWNLFAAGKNTARINQTISDRHAIEAQTDYVQHQLATEIKVKQAEMQAALSQYSAAESQLKTSSTYYTDMLKLYKEGLAIYIELLDAQNQWIDAQLQTNITLFDTWIAYTAIERANASFTIQ